ncbi:hypothetical protein [Virgibacillus salidurans]|nr:hypothetical protein [Virgibacillus sp. NKC19-16]
MPKRSMRQLTSVFLIILLITTVPVTGFAGDTGDPRQTPNYGTGF